MLVDDDDTMYIAYGTKTIEVAQLSSDGLSEVRSEVSDAPVAHVHVLYLYSLGCVEIGKLLRRCPYV